MSIRITGGTHRNRQIPLSRHSGLRPTSEKVRGAIFSILGLSAIEGSRILDLYAGTGALGIEALSRGALWVDFVESNRRRSSQIYANLKRLSLEDKGRVYTLKAEKALTQLSTGYDVVFADPPYSFLDVWVDVMGGLWRNGLLKDEGMIVTEHRFDTVLHAEYDGLCRKMTRRYGDTAVSIFVLGPANG
mgnify:FL=1